MASDRGLLDHPVHHALAGPHARFALHRGRVARYPADVSPFVALPPDPAERDWADLAELAGPGAVIAITGGATTPPAGWDILMEGEGVQLVGDAVDGAPDPEALRLGPADVVDMLDLVGRTKPGPFLPRTIELGTYLGIRVGGALVAMAGERLHPQGWTEISAVCTDEAYRARGYATRLVRAVAAGIRARGETPFLHAAAENSDAIRLYESLGFAQRRRPVFLALQVPAEVAPAGLRR